jgi:hypothetical protein
VKSYRSFSITFIIITILTLGSVATFNFLMDPLWTFNHSHPYNDIQTVIDERQQKVNQIHYSPFNYDTLLIGSSRSTYINPKDFHDMDVYNFSASDLSFKEYKSFIDYAKKEKGSSFNRIIIGVDFFKSSIPQSNKDLTLDNYIKKREEPLYRFQNLISLDVLEYSKKNFRLSKRDVIVELRNYNRENTAFAKKIAKETKVKQTEEKVQKFRRVFYGKNYKYNTEFKQILMQLKTENPNTEFIIFTTPISTPLFSALVEEGQFKDYQRWLNDIISVFGGVYNFMYPNSITNNLDNYFDGHHFYPNVGSLIASKISQPNKSEAPQDFGVYLTPDNFEKHMKEISDSVK